MLKKNGLVVATMVMLLMMGWEVWSADGNPAYTNADDAGIDFKIQGEYEGTIDADGSRWGAQIIALGDGKFRSIGFQGGLPGNGWQPGNETNTMDGTLQGDVAVFDAAEFVGRVDGRTLKVETVDGEELGQLKKVERKSPTLGDPAPSGAIVLFDGSNVDHWNNGRMTDGKFLAASGTDTKQSFGDQQLHVEFRTPFMPKSRGQGRGNSGVYVQSHYEIQVLDSFGLEARDNECGGMYSVSTPKVNMCFPPLSWQTYDIDFTAAKFDADGNKTANARVTVRQNGVVIHDDLEIPHSTPGRVDQESAQPAPLFLQDHGNPVVFRNIWVVEK